MTLEELQDNEDEFSEEDERAIEMYRQQRLAEWKATQLKNKLGEVLEISGKDYVQEVTKAGEGLWVVLHLYKQGIPLCALINQHLSGLARKFPDVTFVKAISTTCIPNYPDRNLPTVFVYLEGDIKAQLIGPLVFGGMNLTRDGKRSCRQARVCVCVCVLGGGVLLEGVPAAHLPRRDGKLTLLSAVSLVVEESAGAVTAGSKRRSPVEWTDVIHSDS